jgi:hypothetical protein
MLTVGAQGAYSAAIGKRAAIHGEIAGREMGISTWISFGGINSHAIVHREFGESPDDIRKVLEGHDAEGSQH